jgi:hypothetical protein
MIIHEGMVPVSRNAIFCPANIVDAESCGFFLSGLDLFPPHTHILVCALPH